MTKNLGPGAPRFATMADALTAGYVPAHDRKTYAKHEGSRLFGLCWGRRDVQLCYEFTEPFIRVDHTGILAVDVFVAAERNNLRELGAYVLMFSSEQIQKGLKQLEAARCKK